MPDRKITISVDRTELGGLVVEPRTGMPGILFVHGWAGSQERDRSRALGISQLGCICLTFDMRGHGARADQLRTVTRRDNLADLCAAYDALTEQPNIDTSAIAVVGSSYGGYLAALLTAHRPVRWLALRVPALYRDDGWTVPKFSLNRADLARYRQRFVPREENLVLRECERFKGDVLIVESENDDIVPHPAVASYLSAFINARSVTYRILEGADHALSRDSDRQAYDTLLLHWVREMILGAR
ncbi:hypothetical protein GGR16_003657 [Chelatococcus caeni]|uniref:Peptidase S9 prolyl oligopeptidase catalytic domain-containing protein n=1 Tax=Chelatococcus caeni TaxID=1348468 RepID=A0A840C074_9HYPH|nr:hypothetical protein [Chelatococcus caeni]